MLSLCHAQEGFALCFALCCVVCVCMCQVFVDEGTWAVAGGFAAARGGEGSSKAGCGL